MTIKYQTQLENHPSITSPIWGFTDSLGPLPLDQITALEHQYNKEQPFPAALRELLYLAGGSCYALEYGISDTQQHMQQDARSWLTYYDRNLSINRPFYVIDVYNGSDQFLFVYLDEGTDDPQVYEAVLAHDELPDQSWIHDSNSLTLSGLINLRISKLLQGFNPF